MWTWANGDANLRISWGGGGDIGMRERMQGQIVQIEEPLRDGMET